MSDVVLLLKQTSYVLQGRNKAESKVLIFHSVKTASNPVLHLVSYDLKVLNREDRMHWKIKEKVTYLLITAINSSLSFVLSLSFRYCIP